MEQYCAALLNQEKSLEDLQRHLRTTEELFRESVKRKNQQLDLLQNEVRRLKTSVGVRDEAAALQIDAALKNLHKEHRLNELPGNVINTKRDVFGNEAVRCSGMLFNPDRCVFCIKEPDGMFAVSAWLIYPGW